MDELLKIKGLSLTENSLIFDDLSFILNYDENYTMVCNDSKKLIELIIGLKNTDSVCFNFLDLNEKNRKEIQKRISWIHEDIDLNLLTDDVIAEMYERLTNYDWDYKKERVTEILDLFDIDKNVEFKKCSYFEKCVICLALNLVNKPKLLIIDKTFDLLGIDKFKQIVYFLKKYQKTSKLTILNITNNLEYSLFFDNLIIINKKLILCDTLKNAYSLKLDDYRLPFNVSLSKYLQLYELIDKNYLKMEDLVDDLWN